MIQPIPLFTKGTAIAGAIFLALAACSIRQEAQTLTKAEPVHESGCLEVSEELRSRNEATIFVGFGEAFTSEDATSAATADLVRQIQTKVSSLGVTQETNRSVEISSLTQSTVDSMLTGMIVAKRCHEGVRWQVVAKLEKALFFRNIQLRVQPVLKEASALLLVLRTAGAPAQELLAAAARGLSLVHREGATATDLVALCRTFNSCSMLSESELSTLEKAAVGIFGRFAFLIRAKDKEAAAVSPVVSRLLSEEGFALASTSNGNDAGLSCQRKDFPPMAQTGYMVTEILCGVTFSTGSGDAVTGLTRAYLGNGLGESREEALSEARRKLARQE